MIAQAEFLLKAVATIIAISGAFVTVMKWLDQRHKDSIIAQIEAQKPFSTKQQEVYLELVNITAIIGNRQGTPEWDAAIARFWIMFWGVVPMVADERVALATDQFSIALDDVDNGIGLRNASMDLAKACRKSLGETWNADFRTYPKSKQQISN